MIKQSFFYNYTANKFGGYNRFSYGIMTAELDNDADDVDIADYFFEQLKATAKKDHPDADINITAFNRV
jgi:hypothetical protein